MQANEKMEKEYSTLSHATSLNCGSRCSLQTQHELRAKWHGEVVEGDQVAKTFATSPLQLRTISISEDLTNFDNLAKILEKELSIDVVNMIC